MSKIAPRWQIVEGDCADVLTSPLLDGAACVVTDPPYGVSIGSHGGAHDGRSAHVLVKAGYASTDDSPEAYRRDVVPRLASYIRMVDRAAVFSAGHMMWDLPRPNAVGGVFLPAAQGRCAWGFSSLSHVCLYGRAPALQLGCRATAIASTEQSEPNGHPVPKPIGWMLWLVRLVSLPDELVVDPFAGSGTTGVACLRLGRRFVGIEKDPQYAAIARERLEAETRQQSLGAYRAGQGVLFGGRSSGSGGD